MAHHLEALAPERIGDREDVVGQAVQAVGVDALRLAGQVVAALVGGGDAEAGVGQGADQVAPLVPEFRESVQKQDQFSLALFHIMQLDAVELREMARPAARQHRRCRIVRGHGLGGGGGSAGGQRSQGPTGTSIYKSPDGGITWTKLERIAQAERGETIAQLANDHVVDALFDEQARARAADVALVEVDAVDDALDRLVERGVGEDDVGGLAAELEGDRLLGAGDGARDGPAHLGGAGERDLVDARVLDQRAAGVARARDDVDHARREVGLVADVGEEQRREGRRLGRLEHHRVARGERRGDPRERNEESPGDFQGALAFTYGGQP